MAKKEAGGALVIRADPTTEALAKAYSTSQRGWVNVAVLKSANVLRSTLIKTTPRKTGRLLASQRLIKVSDLERKIVETVDPPYGLFQREGVPASKINPILPRRKKALFWPGARHPVAIVRNHPGIKKNDYWQLAIDQSAPERAAQVTKAVEGIVASVDI